VRAAEQLDAVAPLSLPTCDQLGLPGWVTESNFSTDYKDSVI